MRFTKMHGCGNDYVYVWLDDTVLEENAAPDCVRALYENVPDEDNPVLGELVTAMSDRHYGIGSDGVIFIRRFPTLVADFEMMMYNADGSRSQMCGNGMRCVAKYVYERGLTAKTRFDVVSCGTSYTVFLNTTPDRSVESVTVNMGEPGLTLHTIPVAIPPEVIEQTLAGYDPRPRHLVFCPLQCRDNVYFFTPVSMGNPHAVVFLPPDTDLDSFDVEGVGRQFERHPYFPQGVNVEFVIADNQNNVRMRVWERGSGETLCCGTGCSAVTVAGVLCGLTGDNVTVHARGGDVICNWKQPENAVFMTGPAEDVFDGEIYL